MCIEYGKAERADSGRISELFAEMLRTIHGSHDAKGYPDGYPDRFFAGQEDRISVARANGRIIAFLSIEVHREEEDYLYLDDFSVTEEYRNRGIGTKLLESAESCAKEMGVNTLCLHVEKTNAAALRLYRRLGYEVYREQESRYLMLKRLG